MALGIGSKADVTMLNVTIQQYNPDNTYVLVQLPDTNPPSDPLQFWLPVNDLRVTIKSILPASWPPIEGDVWIVPGVTQEAFVVSDGQGGEYFLTPDTIRDAYNTHAAHLPPTADQALAAYGSSLTLLYRKT